MRGVALLLGGPGSFSIGGTLNIFAFGALAGPLFGLAYHTWFARLKFPAPVRGLLFGLLLAITLQLPGLIIAPDFRAELMVIGPLGFGIFALMNVAFVVSLAWIAAWLDQAWPTDDARRHIEQPVTLIFTLLAVAGLALLVFEIGRQILTLLR